MQIVIIIVDTVISIHALLAESDSRAKSISAKICHFYPRSPCGERLELLAKWFCNSLISIHALLAESDRYRQTSQSYKDISIHALLAESDASGSLSDTSDVISIHALLAESDR